jgi:glycerol-3-phosphate dehydrogenase
MNRTSTLTRLSDERWDLLVIGGGISGAGVAREAALRGLKVALVEQGDFAGGTSSRSGKMIIGGLRYLLNRQFHLVRKGLQERDWLVRMAPHLVHWTPYLFPVWSGDPDPLWKLRLGLKLYDAFGGVDAAHRHAAFDAEGVRRLEPGLRAENLRGAVQYWDAMTDDARLTIEILQSASSAGAAVANYAAVEQFTKKEGRITGVIVRDLLGEVAFEVQARAILTAAGPWTDALRKLDDPSAAPLLRLVKGSFMVVPRERLPVTRNVTLRAPDQRMTFAVPFRAQTYLGTTEVDFSGNPNHASASLAEVEYLLASARRAFPEANLCREDVISTWAGLRPLIGSRPGQSPSQVSRDYQIIKSAAGLAILAGGKLTGFRAMGEHVVNELFPGTRCKGRETSLVPLPGAVGSQPAQETISRLAGPTNVSAEWLTEKLARYGSRLPEVAEEFAAGAKGPREWLLAQTRFAVKHEMAQRLTDVLWRRTGVMIFERGNGLEEAPAVASEMAALLGWSSQRMSRELEDYRAEVDRLWAWRKTETAAVEVSPGADACAMP